MFKLLSTTLLCLFGTVIYAQCFATESLADRVRQAEVFVVGQVIESTPFRLASGEIYTKHTVRVDEYGSLDGSRGKAVETVRFYTMGGQIGDEMMVATPSLQVDAFADGLFLLRNTPGDWLEDRSLLQPVSLQSSLLPYDAYAATFRDGTETVGGIEALHEKLAELAPGVQMNRVSERSFKAPAVADKLLAPAVTSISPRVVRAGVQDVITINGSGFGSATGNVFFDNPDDGPGGQFVGTPQSTILAWSDTQIRIEVAGGAGSGTILVRDAAGQQTQSSATIEVRYNITNVRTTTGGVFRPRLIDDGANGDGGYTFQLSNSNANNGRALTTDAPALAAIRRAFATWNRDGDFNIRISSVPTSIQEPISGDNVNIISYDNDTYDFDDRLGRSTVGIAFSYYSSCGDSRWEVVGTDVLFRRPGNPNGRGGSVNYNFGPGNGPGTDFESVALHEFGHVNQLGHVMDLTDVMAFRVSSGSRQRVLSSNTLAGAKFVSDLSVAYDPPIIRCGGDFNFERSYETFSEANGSLPVTWAYFDATPTAKTTLLEWGTTDEVNAADIFVERSADGRAFEAIATLEPRGNEDRSAAYTYEDLAPPSGTNLYRIKQVDFDGSAHYSPVRQVNFEDLNAGLRAYPNPVATTLRVRNADLESGARLRIYNAVGQLVHSQEVNRAAREQVINVAALPRGQYLLRDGAGQSLRFVR